MGKLLLSVVIGIAVAGAQEGPTSLRGDVRGQVRGETGGESRGESLGEIGGEARGGSRGVTRPDFTAGPAKRLWLTSVGALTMANVADAQSSWGKRELNPTLAGNAGTFGLGGTLIKAGIVSGMIGVEYLLLRRHPGKSLYRKVSIINFGAAAFTGGVAAHNYTLPRR